MATAGSKNNESLDEIIEGIDAMSLNTGMFKLEAY